MRVYICAPFASDSLAGIRANVARAVILADFARRFGYDPVVPHVAGLAEVGASGGVETPEVRAAAMERCLREVQEVAEAGGVMWVLLRADGTPSDGCAVEMARCQRMNGVALPPRLWRKYLDDDLRARWDALGD